MKPLRAEFDLTTEDMAAAVEAVADRAPGVRSSRRTVRRAIVVLVLFLSACVALDFVRHKPVVVTISMACHAGAVGGLLLLFPTRKSWAQKIRAQTIAALATPAGKACLGPRSVEVGRDGLHVASGFAHTVVTWRGVIDVIPTAGHLVAVVPGPAYLSIPRRAFASDSEFERFGETVAELAAAGGGLTARSTASGP